VRPETVLNDGQRIFIFRQVNGWTNISLESTENAPKLTCHPITALITAWKEFSTCPAVSEVIIKWKGSDDRLTYDDIAGMESQFLPLPEATGDDTPDKTDAEVLFEAISDLCPRSSTPWRKRSSTSRPRTVPDRRLRLVRPAMLPNLRRPRR
jgi:hypothetical protein